MLCPPGAKQSSAHGLPHFYHPSDPLGLKNWAGYAPSSGGGGGIGSDSSRMQVGLFSRMAVKGHHVLLQWMPISPFG